MRFFEILIDFEIIGHCHAATHSEAEKIAFWRYYRDEKDWSRLSVREIK